jgi:DNA-binding response OmpR family regulator
MVDWVLSLPPQDKAILDGIVCCSRAMNAEHVRLLRQCVETAIVAVADRRSLEETLQLFQMGFDDVLSKPIHPLEILARLKAARNRTKADVTAEEPADILLFANGRDPLVGGEPLTLPRRERRVLTCLVEARGAWIAKATLFNQVYGMFNSDIHDSTIESHVSRLRRRLRERLGREVIETQRHLGYRLVTRHSPRRDRAVMASVAQAEDGRLAARR